MPQAITLGEAIVADVAAILEWMYRKDPPRDNFAGILALANQYQVIELEIVCAEMLLKHMFAENAIHTLRSLYTFREAPHLKSTWERVHARFCDLTLVNKNLQADVVTIICV